MLEASGATEHALDALEEPLRGIASELGDEARQVLLRVTILSMLRGKLP